MSDLLMRRLAVIVGNYRYELRRIWDDRLPLLVVVMLNPSTADAEVDDPTILTLIHFARLWGYGGLLIVNLYAFRSSSPAVMAKAADPIGPLNADFITKALKYANQHGGRVLVGWGNCSDIAPAALGQRTSALLREAKIWGVETVCLGVTQSGAPKHPMARGVHRIPRDQKPTLWMEPQEHAHTN